MEQITEVIAFWRDEVGPERWYQSNEELDRTIRERFEALWQAAHDGELDDWADTPRGALALVILCDQLPRNMFRGHPKSFATDRRARETADRAIAEGYDMAIDDPLRQFFYVPFLHSESLLDQERGVELYEDRMPDEHLRHARAHRAVIARFGRFPWRNPWIGRATSDEEAAFLWAGGYDWAVRAERKNKVA